MLHLPILSPSILNLSILNLPVLNLLILNLLILNLPILNLPILAYAPEVSSSAYQATSEVRLRWSCQKPALDPCEVSPYNPALNAIDASCYLEILQRGP
jgi:hypothetical protein